MMLQCVPYNMFNTSDSWILKSGVNLEYTPEDTLKSTIIQNQTNENLSNVCDSSNNSKPVVVSF